VRNARMKAKLTLSVPEKTVREAKQIARLHKTSVSALFAASVAEWRAGLEGLGDERAAADAGWEDLLGVFEARKPFDHRSKLIREKHG